MLGQNRVKPSEYFRPSAQPISKNHARKSASQAADTLPCAPCGSTKPGFQTNRPERAIRHVLERYRHDFARAVDRHVAKELQAFGRRRILALLRARRLDVA